MPQERFGSFRAIASIASGPLTEVVRCVQEPLGRFAAVKTLKPSISPSSPFAVAISREAHLLASLHHESIPRVLEFVQTDDTMWFAMELVDGPTLESLLAQAGKLEPTAAYAIALELARALAHAHDRGVVHCDVRPSNILIAKDGRVVLTDFGAALAEHVPAAPEPIEAESALEVPAYMSPEQILGEQLDPRSDLFLLGVVLYEMLAGHRPFEAHEGSSVAHSIRHDEAPALHTHAPNVSRTVVKLIAACLQKMPGDRPSSAHELVDALENAYAKLTALPRSHVVALALARSQFIDRPPPIGKDHPDFAGTPLQRPSIGSALRIQLLMLALIVGGAAAIHLSFGGTFEGDVAAGRGPLELTPNQAGSLRVIAQPWAEVIVDGQPVETTPFARPIPLSAGVHHVTLRHPAAPDERRVVKIAPGEHVMLDVTMRVKTAPKPETSAPVAAPTSSTP